MTTRLTLRRYVAEACDGPFGSAMKSEHYSAEGARIIRLGNIGPTKWRDKDHAYIDLKYWQTLERHHVRAGDLLVAGLGDENNPVGRACVVPDLGPAMVKADCFRLRLHPLLGDAQFVAYFLSYGPGRHLAGALADGSTRKRLTLGKLMAIEMPPLPVQQQNAIAHYLDSETARIDALIAKKQRLQTQVLERFDAWRESLLLRAAQDRWVPLHHLTDPYRPIVYGIVQAGPEVPGGIPYIKTGDMADLRPERLCRTSVEIDEAYRRARVIPGDIVMAMRASIGLPVVVPPDLPVANLTQGTARIAAGKGVDPSWLFQAIQTHAVQEQCRNRAVGTTFKTLNIWDLRRVAIPTPPRGAQLALAQRIRAEQAHMTAVRDRLKRQVDLLVEHRQALVTAAVTGEFDIPRVAA